MSNPVAPPDDQNVPVVTPPPVINAQAAIVGAVVGTKPAKKDEAATVAGTSTGGVDIEALALKVFALMKEEVRIERERSVRS